VVLYTSDNNDNFRFKAASLSLKCCEVLLALGEFILFLSAFISDLYPCNLRLFFRVIRPIRGICVVFLFFGAFCYFRLFVIYFFLCGFT